MTATAATARGTSATTDAAPAGDEARETPPSRWRAALLAAIGVGFGLSALEAGLYSLTQWGPVAFAALAVLFVLVVAAPAPLSRPGVIAILGLLGLGTWSLLSALWGSADPAFVEGYRWLLYASTVAVLLLLVRDGRLA